METYVVIILSVSVIVFLYILYLAFFKSSVTNLIDDPVDFSKETHVQIKSSSIPGMGSAYFSLSCWVYVKTWTNENNKTINSFMNNETTRTEYSTSEIASTSSNAVGKCPADNDVPSWSSTVSCTNDANVNLALILDKKSPTLYLYYRYATSLGIPLLITNNFPLQKWTNVIVSFENQILDVYIDGKLIKSNSNLGYYKGTTGTFEPKPFIGNNTTTAILFGGDAARSNISVARAAYIPFAMDPQYAMQIYRMGSGASEGDYSVNLALMKNNTVYNNIQLY